MKLFDTLATKSSYGSLAIITECPLSAYSEAMTVTHVTHPTLLTNLTHDPLTHCHLCCYNR